MLTRLATVLALSSAGLFAQNFDFDLDKTSAGTLGASLDLAFSGAPTNTLGLILVSTNGGPTPLSIVNPNDPRSVLVGTELSAAWIFTVTSGTGTGGFSLPLPANPGFTDLVFHWQTVTLPGSGPTFVGDISNNVVTQLSVADTGLLAREALTAARAFGAGFFDRDNNAGAGDLVVAGGGAGTLTSATGLASTEVWDFRTMTVSAGTNMNSARALHLVVPLDDGRVLIIGGANAAGTVLASCEVYDPSTGNYTATGSMGTPRILHAACKLADGRVMTAGGTSTLVDLTSTISGTLSSAEIWDPNAGPNGTWSSANSIGGRRLAPALSLLGNGDVMVSGGVQVSFLFGIPISASSTTAVQRWNPGSGNWSSGPNMSQGRAGHQYNQVTLGNGDILLTGGIDVPNLLGAANAVPINGAERFNGSSWTTVNMNTARALHSATLLDDGRVAVCGGAQGTLTTPSSIAAAELFDPSNNTWTTLPPLTSARSGHVAGVTPDGTLLLFGGQGATSTTTTIETLRF